MHQKHDQYIVSPENTSLFPNFGQGVRVGVSSTTVDCKHNVSIEFPMSEDLGLDTLIISIRNQLHWRNYMDRLLLCANVMR